MLQAIQPLSALEMAELMDLFEEPDFVVIASDVAKDERAAVQLRWQNIAPRQTQLPQKFSGSCQIYSL